LTARKIFWFRERRVLADDDFAKADVARRLIAPAAANARMSESALARLTSTLSAESAHWFRAVGHLQQFGS
jgi:hypothetical protein